MDHTVVVKTEMQSNGEILLFYVDGECGFFTVMVLGGLFGLCRCCWFDFYQKQIACDEHENWTFGNCQHVCNLSFVFK